MYVFEAQFEEIITPAIKKIYNENIECTPKNCHFKSACSLVVTNNVTLNFILGKKDGNKGYPVSINIEDHLVPGTVFGEDKNICYFPIFLMDPQVDTMQIFDWYLGNMFLNKYFVVNDMTPYEKDASALPTISLFDKSFLTPDIDDGGDSSGGGNDQDQKISDNQKALIAGIFGASFFLVAIVAICLYKTQRPRG